MLILTALLAIIIITVSYTHLDDTAVNMRRMFDVVLDKLNKAKEQVPQDLEYVKSLVAQMDEVVAKINHQNLSLIHILFLVRHKIESAEELVSVLDNLTDKKKDCLLYTSWYNERSLRCTEYGTVLCVPCITDK